MNFRQHRVGTLALLTGAILATAMVGGCKNKESQIAGKWADDKGQTVEFKADKSFLQGTGNTATTGKWTFADPTITVSIEALGGKPIDEALKGFSDLAMKMNPNGKKPDLAKLKAELASITMTLSDDGKKMTMKMPAGSNAPAVTLTKQG